MVVGPRKPSVASGYGTRPRDARDLHPAQPTRPATWRHTVPPSRIEWPLLADREVGEDPVRRARGGLAHVQGPSGRVHRNEVADPIVRRRRLEDVDDVRVRAERLGQGRALVVLGVDGRERLDRELVRGAYAELPLAGTNGVHVGRSQGSG